MRRVTRFVAAAAMCAVGMVAAAKLPPPSAEEVAVAAAKKEQAAAQLEKEKQLLENAQNRVADQYKRSKGISTAGTKTVGRTETTNMPKTTKELPGDAGPKGGTKQSAEAHSAPAK